MTTPDKPTPVPPAQKLWTAQSVQALAIHNYPRPEDWHRIADAHNASLPKQEDREALAIAKAYGRGVSAGKREALQYTLEERERYGRWIAQSEPSNTERELRAALEDTRSTLMNCGIDNNTPMGLQLRKASGRITILFDKLDSAMKAERETSGGGKRWLDEI